MRRSDEQAWGVRGVSEKRPKPTEIALVFSYDRRTRAPIHSWPSYCHPSSASAAASADSSYAAIASSTSYLRRGIWEGWVSVGEECAEESRAAAAAAAAHRSSSSSSPSSWIARKSAGSPSLGSSGSHLRTVACAIVRRSPSRSIARRLPSSSWPSSRQPSASSKADIASCTWRGGREARGGG